MPSNSKRPSLNLTSVEINTLKKTAKSQSSRSAMPSDLYRYLAMPSDSKKLYERLF